MKNFLCHNCKKEIPSLYSVCPHCGYQYSISCKVVLLDGRTVSVHRRTYYLAYLIAMGCSPADVCVMHGIHIGEFIKLMSGKKYPKFFPQLVATLRKQYIESLEEIIVYWYLPNKLQEVLKSGEDERIIRWVSFVLELSKKGYLKKSRGASKKSKEDEGLISKQEIMKMLRDIDKQPPQEEIEEPKAPQEETEELNDNVENHDEGRTEESL